MFLLFASVTSPFFGYLKLLKATKKGEKSRSKDLR